jgi:hypothetical protein
VQVVFGQDVGHMTANDKINTRWHEISQLYVQEHMSLINYQISSYTEINKNMKGNHSTAGQKKIARSPDILKIM